MTVSAPSISCVDWQDSTGSLLELPDSCDATFPRNSRPLRVTTVRQFEHVQRVAYVWVIDFRGE